METYLRYREDFKALPIHAKEKLRINSNTYVQMNGELDTKVGQLTSSSSILIKHLYSNLSSILGVRLRHCEKFCYIVNAKTMILVPVSILKGSSEVDREFKELPNVLNFEIKGACDVDREFKEIFFFRKYLSGKTNHLYSLDRNFRKSIFFSCGLQEESALRLDRQELVP
ncbi:Outer envelope pore protein [Vigna angularis]|uniref:Outer envelope pore protein n=1 Tax=Phaseolus angularis TaxID=3914 RepID=A0A8T0KVJ5_PHAAN|nr:Outer envelope pore protein [Vigna angularis]